VQLGRRRRPHNRLGSAYQVAFVRLFDPFPQQQPFELFEELVCFNAAQLGLDPELVSRADQTIDTEQIAEQWDRMGQLYASLKTGHVTASVALKTTGRLQHQESVLPRQLL
jgi:hypothetical protein